MNQRLVDIFKDTQKMFNEPDVANAIQNSISKTKLYKEDEWPESDYSGSLAKVTVTKFKSIEAASYYKRKFPDLQVCVLNFASATHPGGGVNTGASAQEESICRITTLYPVLNTSDNQKNFYSFHKNRHNAAYTDTVIYTPDIMILKSDTPSPTRFHPSKRQLVNVITCAAPNCKHLSSNIDLYTMHVKRARHILSIAAANKNDIIILGAFGCGAFQNPPEIVAKAYKEAISDYMTAFEEINFAVYCNPKDTKNFSVFKETLL